MQDGLLQALFFWCVWQRQTAEGILSRKCWYSYLCFKVWHDPCISRCGPCKAYPCKKLHWAVAVANCRNKLFDVIPCTQDYVAFLQSKTNVPDLFGHPSLLCCKVSCIFTGYWEVNWVFCCVGSNRRNWSSFLSYGNIKKWRMKGVESADLETASTSQFIITS